MQLGVDTGGTFTDFVWLGEDGRLQIHKQLSTPDDPSKAITAGVEFLDVPPVASVVHGSTVATNALLERRGARTALITTVGFADVLAIGRQNRPDLYALVPQKPSPLVPSAWRFEVNERVSAQGEILIPLDANSLNPLLDQIAADEIESIAVCLLFSFLRPEHERTIRDILVHHFSTADRGTSETEASNGLHISLSSEVLPEYREFERTATTVVNAYVAPLMDRYLSRLEDCLSPRRLTVMQSNGGVINARTAGSLAARTVLSGPAGGVVGAQFVARQAGFEEIITFDMGGTSTDVALCPGRLPTTAEGEIAGIPLRLPIIDIHTVGAGGGSLAYLDAGDALHVGPQSAGAEPGPSAYGRDVGNWELQTGAGTSRTPTTTTDANLVLGRLDADHFLGGTMRLYTSASFSALAALAESMGSDSAETAAWGVIQVANANMERAIRRISIERGYDPRRFTLVAFGGAGPLHACELAQNLQIPRVLVPVIPGVLSALGMLVAAPAKDYSQTIMIRLVSSGELGGERQAWLNSQYHPLEERALQEMMAEGHEQELIQLRRSVDMRYAGQSHELTVPYGAEVGLDDLLSLFHEAHQTRYGYQRPEASVELVNLRLTAAVAVDPPTLPTHPLGPADARAALLGEKPVWFAKVNATHKPLTTKLYDRANLQPGNRFKGPALVFQYDTTTVIPPGWEAAVDAYANLILERS